MEVDFHSIRERLVVETGMPVGVGTDMLKSLFARYQEPWRHYHTLQHPLELYGLLEEHIDEVEDPYTIGWTIMYHDAVYDPVAAHGRNEELSAQLAAREFGRLDLAVRGDEVARYTRATAGHSVETDADLNFFMDLDLAILGAEPRRYDQYAFDIHQEYIHVPEEQYVLGRIAILQRLATRVEEVGLYRTEVFQANFEAQAQENIHREIDKLKGGFDAAE